MPSPRLRLWQVLGDEYKLFHDAPAFSDLEPAFWLLKDDELKHPHLALSIARQADPVSVRLFKELDEASRKDLMGLDGNSPLSDKLRADIRDGLNKLLLDDDFSNLYEEEKEKVQAIISEAGLAKDDPLSARKHPLVKRWLLEETFPNEIVSIDERLTTACYRAIHKENHSALCLSGGGIRSATFNLGLLQGLARHGLLEKFEYLSTVSGGGFSGGWLSAWINRHPEGLQGVVKELGKETAAAPSTQKPLDPEPEALSWLRNYSNFLSPKLGLFSADTWTLVATILRNIFLNWMVFVPVLMAVLMLPRLWVAFIERRTFEGAEDYSIGIAFIAGLIALLYIGINLPSMRRPNRGQAAFLLRCLLPLVISAMALATYGMRAFQQRVEPELENFIYYQVAIILVPWIVCAFYQYRIRKGTASPTKLVVHFLLATLLIFLAQLITAWLLWKAAMMWIKAPDTPGNHLLYACFAVPLILGLLAMTGILLAGLTSNYTEDEDQEWWARAGAWVFIAIIGWAAISVLVIYGPQLLTRLLGGLPGKLSRGQFFSKEMLATLGAIASGAITIFGGFSAKTPSNDQEAKKSGGLGAMLMGLLMNVAAVVFLVFIISALALLTNSVMAALFYGPWLGRASTLPGTPPHALVILQSPPLLLLLMTALLAIVGGLFGRLINTNKFSLHYLWRNRIIRAYLGASNPNRRPNRFTGFDRNDNVHMHELKPTRDRKLLHVLNFALNLVSGEKLAWQERKAESFSVSPLHCGNYRLGYRRAEDYGGRVKPGDPKAKHGISLGTSIAISGAFVSPNMGYMQSSPVIRFLMTLFNVRFGWWLGNSGRAGDGASDMTRTYDLNGPRLSVKPIVKEALGMTNDRSDYIYLSDGGHFENFGLYEMVLRRCRLVVIGDATSDAEYSFESLGQSLRKIRIDFGIPVEFQKFLITRPSSNEKGVYAAIGTIKYHCIDGGTPKETDGTLILIKPTLLGNETRDILNYATESGTFPQEFIGDQWFSESQFESYRALGSHIIDALCREPGKSIEDRNVIDDLNKFRERVEVNLG
jgi:hypothetical protein